MSYRDEDFKDIRALRKSYTLEKAPRTRPSLQIQTEMLGHTRSKSTEKWGTPSHTRIRDSTAYSPLGLVAKSRPELETTVPSMRGLLQRDLSSAKLKRRMELPVEDPAENKTPKSRAEIHEEIRNKIKSMSMVRLKKDKEEEIEFDVEELKGPLIDTQGTLGDEINQEEDKINRKREEIHYENHGEDQESKEISIIEYLKGELKSRKATHEEDMHNQFEEKSKQGDEKLYCNQEAFSKEGEKPIVENQIEAREKGHKELAQKRDEQETEIYQDQNQTQSKDQNSLHIKPKDIKALTEGETVQFTFREEKEGNELRNERRQETESEKPEKPEALDALRDQETAKIDPIECKPANQKESDGNISDENRKGDSHQELESESESESENSIEQSISESDSEEIAQFQENESLARAENEIELGGNKLFNTENSEEEYKGQAGNDKQGVGTMEKEIKEGEQEIQSPTTKKVKKGGKKKKKTKKKDEAGEKDEKGSKPKKTSTKKKERSKSQEKDSKKLVKKVSLVKISPSKVGDSDKTKRKSSPKRISIKLQPAGRKSLTNRSESETDSPKKRKSLLNHSREKSVDRSRSSNSSSPGKVVKVKSILKKSKTILTDAQEIPKKEQEIKILENFESPKNAQGIIEHQKKKELKKSKTQEATVSVDLTQYSSNNHAEQAKPNKKSEAKPEAVTLNLNDKQTSSKSKEAMSPTKSGRGKEISISVVVDDKSSKLVKSPSQKKMIAANQDTEKNPTEKELSKQTGNATVKEKSPTKINKVQATKH